MYRTLVNCGSPKGRAKKYASRYKHIALVWTDLDFGPVAIRNTQQTRIVRDFGTVHYGKGITSEGRRIEERLTRAEVRLNRMIDFRIDRLLKTMTEPTKQSIHLVLCVECNKPITCSCSLGRRAKHLCIECQDKKEREKK